MDTLEHPSPVAGVGFCPGRDAAHEGASRGRAPTELSRSRCSSPGGLSIFPARPS